MALFTRRPAVREGPRDGFRPRQDLFLLLLGGMCFRVTLGSRPRASPDRPWPPRPRLLSPRMAFRHQDLRPGWARGCCRPLSGGGGRGGCGRLLVPEFPPRALGPSALTWMLLCPVSRLQQGPRHPEGTGGEDRATPTRAFTHSECQAPCETEQRREGCAGRAGRARASGLQARGRGRGQSPCPLWCPSMDTLPGCLSGALLRHTGSHYGAPKESRS